MQSWTPEMPERPVDRGQTISVRPIDRLSPAVRPERQPVARQEWRHLTYLHWPAPTEALLPLLPPGLDLDLHRGRAWVGIVAFAARRSRVLAMPELLSLDFLEINVRTYVHCRGVPGVYFFSLDASSHLAAMLSRLAVGLPYVYSTIRLSTAGRFLEFHAARPSGHRPAFRLHLEIGDTLGLSPPGTLDHFLLERYVLYVRRMGGLWRGRIHHPPLLARKARVLDLEDELIASAGMPGYGYSPMAVHHVAGTDVEFFAPEKCVNPGE